MAADMTARTIAVGGTSYPLVLPNIRDPRLHVAAVIITVHVLGQVGLHFRVSVPQILAAIVTCATIEVALTFRASRALRVAGERDAHRQRRRPDPPGHRHAAGPAVEHGTTGGSSRASAGLSLLTKYVIKWRGSHVFNPSNIGLVVAFLVFGSQRVEPLDFWWGPLNGWLRHRLCGDHRRRVVRHPAPEAARPGGGVWLRLLRASASWQGRATAWSRTRRTAPYAGPISAA